MTVTSSERTKLTVTANSLLAQLDKSTTAPPASDPHQRYLDHLKQTATVKHVRELLAKLDRLPPPSGPSTSQSSTALLYHRLATVESALRLTPSVPRSRPLKRPANKSLAPQPPARPSPSLSSISLPSPAEADEREAPSPPHEATDPLSHAGADATFPPPPPRVNVVPPPKATPTKDGIAPPPRSGVPPPPKSAKLSSPSTSPKLGAGKLPSVTPATSTPPASLRIRSAAARAALLKSNKDPDAPDPKTSASSSATSGPSALLDHHHALQSELISSLASMSGQLKANAVGFGDKLEKDKEVMEEAKQKLEENHGGMTKQGERLKGYSGKQKGTTCWTIAVVAGVAVAWVGVFMLIKVT